MGFFHVAASVRTLHIITCLGAFALYPLVVSGSFGCGHEVRPRNAVVIVLDTARRDRFSIYGHERSTTPNLERLAERSVVFDRAVSNAAWTLPAVAGLLAGDYVTGEVFDRGLKRSLVETLSAAGFATAAFTEAGYVSTAYGMARGFDVFQQRPHIEEDDAARTFGAARAWLAENGSDQPFFLLVHTYEPHLPYTHDEFARDVPRGHLDRTFEFEDAARIMAGQSSIDDEELEYVRALYDGGLLTADRQVGLLLESLDELGLADETLVVVTSDHGEDLGDREPRWPGIHGHTVHHELVLVPLVIHDPTRQYPISRVEAQVRTIDTLTTVLDLLDVEAPTAGEGRSLLPLMLGEETRDRIALTRIRENPRESRHEQYALRTGDRVLIVQPKSPGVLDDAIVRLYDVERDPGERSDIAAVEPDLRDALLTELASLRSQLLAEGRADLRPRVDAPTELNEQLRALGYAE